ncbi:Carboxypeptidase regulatory-like domain-containing protein [Streptomyces sp. cf386]|uniref:carboxypeptidase-like regulatory domain-containing protein n=1 Tax=Streptomyces sp. cf386 TaxID=1761904 RepID=UPI0008861884|nr:carboxypeptidase-like regulatory domain-containing protein [Streptomyces sp. cf386]SDM94384.1 Carboxypeptidase regulatory-like domain-containing protein [Streptomyces sp. cf386]
MSGIRQALLTGVVLAALTACGTSSGDGQDGGGAHGTVSGKVRAADGTGVPGCPVVPKLVEGDVGVPEKSVVSKEDGSYSWPLPPGTYDFTVVCDNERDPAVPDRYDGLEGSSSNVQVPSGGTTALDIDLS